MRTKFKMKKIGGGWNRKKIQFIKLIQIKEIAIKKAGTKSYWKKTWRVIVKCCKGIHKNQERKRK
jgi:hypothetical protein